MGRECLSTCLKWTSLDFGLEYPKYRVKFRQVCGLCQMEVNEVLWIMRHYIEAELYAKAEMPISVCGERQCPSSFMLYRNSLSTLILFKHHSYNRISGRLFLYIQERKGKTMVV